MNLRDTQLKYGITFKKQLGQNLLLDDNINRIMVEAADVSDVDDVVEVGAGLGALTRCLSPLAKRVLAVEIDASFMPCLEEQFGETSNVSLFRGDILNHNVEKLVGEYLPSGTHYKMLSNLPYYITTPILFQFWESSLFFSRMVVMVQEEVAMRMVAKLGAKDYGVLRLASEYYSKVDVVRKVPRTCFKPVPKVDSAIVRLRNREVPLYPDIDRVFLLTVIRSAFMHRRKTLKNSLTRTASFGLSGNAVSEALEAANIDGGRRAQTLALDEFAMLATELKRRV